MGTLTSALVVCMMTDWKKYTFPVEKKVLRESLGSRVF